MNFITFHIMLRIIEIDQTNVHYVSDFLMHDLPQTFRYFKTRNIDVVKNHVITTVLLDDDRAVGYAHIDYENKHWFGICILNEYQGKGFGNKMMNHIFNNEKIKKLEEVYLTVDLINEKAMKLYEKFNFFTIEKNKYRCTMKKVISELKQPNAYFVSHNGLGDNITNIGAVKFLLNFYEKIHFLCKENHSKNVKELFLNESESVVVVSFDGRNEFNEIKRILHNVSTDSDIFASGVHKKYIKNRIRHPRLLSYRQNDKNYTVEFKHIRDFYYDIGLDLSIYYEFFDIKSTEMSKRCYEEIKTYKIIFIHSKASNFEVNYDHVYEKYKNNNEYIIICANKNMYDQTHEFHIIAKKYVNLYVAWYIDIIKNSELFYMIDSCFSCILYPLVMTNRISKDKFNLHVR